MKDEILIWAKWALQENFPRRNYSQAWRERVWRDIAYLRWIINYDGELLGLGFPSDLSTLPGLPEKYLRKTGSVK